MAGLRAQLQLNERRGLLMGGDILAVIVSVLIALRVWSLVGRIPFSVEFIVQQWFWFPLFIVLWLVLANANDFYDLRVVQNRARMQRRLLFITLQMGLVYLFIFFFSGREALPRLFTVYFAIALFLLIALWRLVYPSVAGWTSEPRRVLVVGTDWAASVIINVLCNEASDDYTVIGVIGDEDESQEFLNGVPLLGTGSDLPHLIGVNRVSELVVTSTSKLSGTLFQGVMDALAAGINVTPMPLLYEHITGRVPVEEVNDNWAVVLPLDENGFFRPYSVFKRILDGCLALIGLVGLALLLPVVAVLIKLDSPGPIFYNQRRVGLNGREFTVYKFRSMCVNAEAKTGPVLSTVNDQRKTRFGSFMRKTRIDELPQFWNVLLGQMSMVGPRPERPELVADYATDIPFYRTRHMIRPGLTGWAQVQAGYAADRDDTLKKLQYDLYYIRHKSLLLDLNILLRTVGQVIRMTGV